MGREPAPRRIQVIDNESRIRSVLDFLLAESDSGAEAEGVEGLRAIPRHSFDALLLDVRRLTPAAEQEPKDVHRICPSLVGRVLAVVVETAGSQTMELLCGNDIPGRPSPRLVRDLCRAFEMLRGTLVPGVRFK